MKRQGTIAAWITAGAVVLTALIGIIPHYLRDGAPSGQSTVIAGMVVNDKDNSPIGQATIVIAGQPGTYVTEDDGNFRIELRGKSSESVRLHVTKDGFRTYDGTVSPPVENFIVLLHKL